MFWKKRSKDKCPNCGSLLASNATFCVDCGRKVKTTKKVDTSVKNSSKVKHCPDCNAKILVSDSIFCMNCGHSLKDKQKQKEKICSSCGAKIIPNSSFCIKCGQMVTERKKSADPEATGILEENDAFGFNDSEPTGMLEDNSAYEEDINNDGAEATSLLDDNFPTIVRMSTGEEAVVNKPTFKIGKERAKVDFWITGNKTISRVHVKILSKSGRYFIWDNNSSNKTYINGSILLPEVETMLADGDIIKLSDEEFKFRL